MSKKTSAPEITAEPAAELPAIPERFSNGGAPAHERDAWIAENRPDLLPKADDTSSSDVESEGGEA